MKFIVTLSAMLIISQIAAAQTTEQLIIGNIERKAVHAVSSIFDIGECMVHSSNIGEGGLYSIAKKVDGEYVPSNYIHYEFEIEFLCKKLTTEYDFETQLRKRVVVQGSEGLHTRPGHDWLQIRSFVVEPVEAPDCVERYSGAIYDELNRTCHFVN